MSHKEIIISNYLDAVQGYRLGLDRKNHSVRNSTEFLITTYSGQMTVLETVFLEMFNQRLGYSFSKTMNAVTVDGEEVKARPYQYY